MLWGWWRLWLERKWERRLCKTYIHGAKMMETMRTRDLHDFLLLGFGKESMARWERERTRDVEAPGSSLVATNVFSFNHKCRFWFLINIPHHSLSLASVYLAIFSHLCSWSRNNIFGGSFGFRLNRNLKFIIWNQSCLIFDFVSDFDIFYICSSDFDFEIPKFWF